MVQTFLILSPWGKKWIALKWLFNFIIFEEVVIYCIIENGGIQYF